LFVIRSFYCSQVPEEEEEEPTIRHQIMELREVRGEA
jgi:hypothetical protein